MGHNGSGSAARILCSGVKFFVFILSLAESLVGHPEHDLANDKSYYSLLSGVVSKDGILSGKVDGC